MARELDLRTWPRRQHYDFFRVYERPFFNLCADVDVTELYRASRRSGGPSFFAATLHASLVAANSVEEFRYRIRGDRVIVHEVIHGGSTVLRDDETFGFGYFDFDSDFDRFAATVLEELERVQSLRALEPYEENDDLIYYSVLPGCRSRASLTLAATPRSRSRGSSSAATESGKGGGGCRCRSRSTTP